MTRRSIDDVAAEFVLRLGEKRFDAINAQIAALRAAAAKNTELLVLLIQRRTGRTAHPAKEPLS